MRGRHTAFLVAALVVAVAAVAGAVIWASSGGDDATKAEYTVAVVAARDRVDASLVRVTKSPTPEELVSRLDEAADQADIAGDEVEDVGPAPGLEDDTKRLVSTLHKLAGELEGTARTLEDPALGATAENVTSLSFKQWDALNAVLNDLKEQGIAVAPLPRH